MLDERFRTLFVSGGTTGAWFDRLSWRHENLFLPYAGALIGKTVLDLGCHDGRWMYLALMSGARHVIGIDARRENIERCADNLAKAGFDEDRYLLRQGDVENRQVLDGIQFDVVLAFGIVYHLLSPLDLLRRVCAASPEMLLIDTAITRTPGPVLRLYEEDPRNFGNAPSSSYGQSALVCHPSEDALTLTLANCGYSAEIRRWTDEDVLVPAVEPVIPTQSEPLVDYMCGNRLLVIASPGADPDMP